MDVVYKLHMGISHIHYITCTDKQVMISYVELDIPPHSCMIITCILQFLAFPCDDVN